MDALERPWHHGIPFILNIKKPATRLVFYFAITGKLTSSYFFFFTALAFGKSVIEPSKISAAKPIDSFNVG